METSVCSIRKRERLQRSSWKETRPQSTSRRRRTKCNRPNPIEKAKGIHQKELPRHESIVSGLQKDKVIMRLIQSTCSDEWPSGQAHEVTKKLNKKFCPTDSIASLQAESDLASIKMKKNEDPSEFHDKLFEVKQRYPSAISDLQVRNAMIR